MVSPTSLLVPPLPRLSQRDSAFTKVTACTLAKSPCDSLHQRLQQFRCLHYCSDCYRVERTSSRTGLTPAVDHHLFTAHPGCPLFARNRRQAPVKRRTYTSDPTLTLICWHSLEVLVCKTKFWRCS